MVDNQLQEVRERLKSGALTAGDIGFIDALLTKAEADGLGHMVDDKRVVARLPNGMDIVK